LSGLGVYGTQITKMLSIWVEFAVKQLSPLVHAGQLWQSLVLPSQTLLPGPPLQMLSHTGASGDWSRAKMFG
jgi:hypothetical protein